jgi:hypothetical protein
MLAFATGPHVDAVVLRVIAERLANATEADELLALSADLVAIAGVVAGSDVRRAGNVVLMARGNVCYRNENGRLTCLTPMHRPPSRPSEA